MVGIPLKIKIKKPPFFLPPPLLQVLILFFYEGGLHQVEMLPLGC